MPVASGKLLVVCKWSVLEIFMNANRIPHFTGIFRDPLRVLILSCSTYLIPP